MTTYLIEEVNLKKDDCRFATTNFKDAAKEFMRKMKAIIMGGCSLQELETFHWLLKKDSPFKPGIPMDFYQVRDLSIENGWMDNRGNWIG